MMTRRELLAASFLAPTLLARETAKRGCLGGAPTSFTVRLRLARSGEKPFDMVEHCHSLGLAGAETILPSTDPAVVRRLRTQAETYNMKLILNTRLPKQEGDVPQFDAAVAACKDIGAIALHAAMTDRRYEQFDSLEAFKANFAQCQASIALAEPVLRKHRIKLAIENHKGWRASEQAAWMGRVSSEWVGVCYDFGNNLSLCEPPEETFELLSPYTIFCHLKDMAVADYPDGFLLSEVPLGQGIIDLKQRVDALRSKDPDMLFCLEMITRDPLKIPVFTDKYWATFNDPAAPLPARDLAKVLELVRKNPPKSPLPRTSGLTTEQQIKAEDDYNRQSIAYARQNLNL
ncbi:MAG: TIM barrel protein [Acidobacteriaceae bacterium]|nr:TIM barrel protein [Acidobacteriaceae bacterium]